MNKKIIIISLLAAAALGAGGVGLYQYGMQQGMHNMAAAGKTAAPAMAKTDPSSWGIAQGEAATRRHMEAGLKGGDVDPVTGRQILYYHDPMMPGKNFDAPAKSPFMDMMLVPAYAGSAGADTGTVTISSRIQQNLGLRTGEVVEGHLTPEISAVGAIAWNERGQFTLQARAAGFVEKLHVRATLDSVTKGQPLFDLYVPDWVAAQEDYLSVRRMQGRNLETLVDAARQRMRQVGMNQAQIALVERSGQVQQRMTLVAPASGVVTELMAREGSTVMAGMLLARINDLSTVWAQAEVPESQAAILREGSLVTATTPALPGVTFKGTLQALLPEVTALTRTRKARMELANPKGQLVPGMFVQMQLTGPPSGSSLLVPSEALIRSGQRTLVMVVEGEAFRPVEVQVGMQQNGQSEIMAGLAKGQKVVLSGQFLIDSEASLKGVEARLGPAMTEPPMPAMPAMAMAETPVPVAKPTYYTDARVEAVAGRVLTLTHPEIAALKWPAMTMDFTLAPELKLPAPPVGSAIEIEFRMQEGEGAQIVKLKRSATGARPAAGAQ
jgi:Cu(I)/Ag(I) efflux system membrane fusion protein